MLTMSESGATSQGRGFTLIRNARRVCALLAFLLLALTPVAAQELRGRIQGTVTDSSGAVIPGSTATLLNDNTGVEVTRTTNDAGQYLFDYVIAGTYTLRVTSEGFRGFEQKNVLVQTRADITVDVTLELGAVSETVTVEETPVQVSFNRTTMETTLDTKMANSLPIVNRNPFLLAQLNPAVNYSGGVETSPYHHWAASQLDVGGNTQERNDVLIDGSSQLVTSKGTYVPTMDAVSEVSVQQNAVDAEFGHSAGGIVSVQMKSGTNDWHGTAYYFGRNPALNAVSDSITHSPNQVRNNTLGATSQNPIIKNKLFNFAAFEWTNLREPRTNQLTLPTALEKSGDFSQTRLLDGSTRMVYDPLTTTYDQAAQNWFRQPFAGNVVPSARFDPAAVRFMQDIWAPNGPGNNITGANNYQITNPMQFKYWNFSDRVDYNINDSIRVFGRASMFKTDQTEPNFANSPAVRKQGSQRDTTQFQGDLVWTINPTTVFNVRGSWSKINDSFYDADAIIGLEGYEEFWGSNHWYDEYAKELPEVYYPGLIVRTETDSGFGRDGFWYQEPSTWNFQSKVSKQAGRHYLKVGGEFRQQRILASRPRPMLFDFRRDYTADRVNGVDTKKSGDAWASMLLGIVDQNSRIQTVAMNRPRAEFYGLFIQDDFKINHRITLNLGLRYEYETSLKDPERRLSRYLDVSAPIPEFQGAGAPVMPAEVTAIQPTPPVYNGMWLFTDDDHPGAWNPQKNLFLPRVGVAIRLSDRMALRVGYARYTVSPLQQRDGDLDLLGSTPYPGFEATTNPLSVLEGVPRAYLNDPYPASSNPLVPAPGKSLGGYSLLGGPALWFRDDFRNAMNERFSVSLQREIWSKIVVDATYFMNYGYNHPLFVEGDEELVNQADPRLAYEYKDATSKSVDNPFYQILTPEQFPGQLRNQQKVSVGTLLTPYPHYQRLEQSPLSEAGQRYHAFQLQVQRPFANGFNFLFGYNYNNSKNQSYFDEQDRYDSVLTWYPAFAQSHRFTLAGIYELPIGRGRKWGGNWNAVADGVLGGWSVSGIYVYRGGRLLHFSGVDAVSGDPRIDNPTRGNWFDTSVFDRQPAFTRRSNPRYWDGLKGPFYSNCDLTVEKKFRITERVSFELRMEAYNLTNSFMGDNPGTSRTSSNFGVVSAQLPTAKGREFQYSGRFRW